MHVLLKFNRYGTLQMDHDYADLINYWAKNNLWFLLLKIEEDILSISVDERMEKQKFWTVGLR